MRQIQISGRPIREERAYLIAEAGVNHDGSLDTAKKLIDVAATAGADCVKFQLFDPESLVRADAPLADYQSSLGGTQFDMLRDLMLDEDEVRALLGHASASEIDFLCTPFSVKQAAFLVEDLGLETVKVGSGDLTFTQLLRYLGEHAATVLLSTGMADIKEIKTALSDLEGAQTVLLHCVSQYPAPVEEANLKSLSALRDLTGDPVGFSDHFLDERISLMARTLGALVVERHFTLDRTLPGPDHAASMDPAQLGQWVTMIREVEMSLGDGVKRAMPSEMNTRSVARRSLVAVHDLAPGDEITGSDLTAIRPADGISPQSLDLVVGSRVLRHISAGSKLDWDDIEETA